MKRNSKEIYVCLTKNLSDDQDELRSIFQRFSGTTRTLPYLRENLRVKEFVQLLNYFPDLLKCQHERNEILKESDEFHEILISFDTKEDCASDDSLSDSSSFLIQDQVQFHSLTSLTEKISTENENIKLSFLRDENPKTFKGTESSEILSEFKQEAEELWKIKCYEVFPLRNLDATPEKKAIPKHGKKKLFTAHNLIFISVIVLSTFIAFKFCNPNIH